MAKERPGKTKARRLRLRDYLKQIPGPPKEHEHELRMERLLKRMLEKSEQLSSRELQYYSRQMMLDDVGLDGQVMLKNARVCLVGLGGLGSTVATQLAAIGVGFVRLVDRDVVEESNLQRQHLYGFDVLRYPKVEAAVKRLEGLNPYVTFEPLPVSVDASSAEGLVEKIDVVVDGLDNMAARYALNRACVKRGIPYVFGSAISTFGNASTIVPGETACLECFYGKLDDRLLPTCSTIGVHASIIGIIASVEVAETLRILLRKRPSLAGKLLYCDVDSMRFEEIAVARAAACPVCGNRPRVKSPHLKRALVVEGCGRNRKRVFTVIPRENLGLNMGQVKALLAKQEGVSIQVSAKMGVAFTVKTGAEASLLSSGVMVIEGAGDADDALSLYKTTVVRKIGIPWSRVK